MRVRLQLIFLSLLLTTSAIAQSTQGPYLEWNLLTGGTGETDLVNNEGTGTGGFAFLNTAGDGKVLTPLMFIDGHGNVGIGTTNPTAKLAVNAGLDNIDPSLTYGARAAFSFQSAQIELAQGAATTSPWAYWLQARGIHNDAWTLALNPSGGNVGIGTINPQYKLSVNGTIQAKEVLVNTGWADYVFQPGYRVRPLAEVAAFIKANHHLPDIPSESEVKENGVSLGDMQAKLLAKIEELTLQMIQLDKKNRALAKKVAQLEGR
jgi:hypothetical protein